MPRHPAPVPVPVNVPAPVPVDDAIPELGIIEGFYGKPWSWEARAATVSFLAPVGYRFYMYAPKGDAWLRRRWQEAHSPEVAESLADLAAHCRGAGVRFGVGLSPYEIWLDFGGAARDALARKLTFLEDVGADDVAILFDDMRGDVPELATRQLEILDFVGERLGSMRLFVCPTYYSDDPVLDRVFGARPHRYLEELCAGLPVGVEVFWTGEEVVSREYSPAHLDRVAAVLGRRPFLWDNYPVNDGQRMSQYLHLRGFTGRPASIAGHIAGHGINPALQPVLSRIPALTLAASYREGAGYSYGEAFRRAAVEVLGPEGGAAVIRDLLMLQDVGLDRLDDEQAADIRSRYQTLDHEGAREVLAWLDGEYRITSEVVRTQ
jgi:hyaluronoglucosaminidase